MSSSFDISIVVMVALALVLGVMIYGVLASAWRILRDDGKLRLDRMLRRQGLPSTALSEAGYQGAMATRRCVVCPDKDECDRWLASGGRASIAKFCPNAGFIARLAAKSRHG
jgi:hypothetical protein